MKIEYIFSGIALIISIVFGIITIIYTRKTIKLEQQAIDFNIKKGAILLMGLLSRYFTIQLSCWDPNGKMLKDSTSLNQYIQELDLLSQEANELTPNPFYIKVLTKYPELNLLWTNLRYFITKSKRDQKMVVNPQVFEKFYDLYFKVKNEIDDKDLFENQFYASTDEAAKFLNVEIKKLKASIG